MNSLKSSRTITKFFFIVGTILFIIQIITQSINGITLLGLYYVVASIIINSIIVLILLIKLIQKEKRTETIKSIGIILINAPIALFYYFIVMNFIL